MDAQPTITVVNGGTNHKLINAAIATLIIGLIIFLLWYFIPKDFFKDLFKNFGIGGDAFRLKGQHEGAPAAAGDGENFTELEKLLNSPDDAKPAPGGSSNGYDVDSPQRAFDAGFAEGQTAAQAGNSSQNLVGRLTEYMDSLGPAFTEQYYKGLNAGANAPETVLEVWPSI